MYTRRDFSKLASAASCLSEYDQHPCRLRLEQASPFLAGLAFDSRRFIKEELLRQP